MKAWIEKNFDVKGGAFLIVIFAVLALGFVFGTAAGEQQGLRDGFAKGQKSALTDMRYDVTMNYLKCVDEPCDAERHAWRWGGKYADVKLEALGEKK